MGFCLYAFQAGTSGIDRLVAGAVLSDGSIFAVGRTSSDWDGEGNAGLSDFAGVMIDPDGVELWRWMVRTWYTGSLGSFSNSPLIFSHLL